jgi:hypothetical protein
MKKMLLALFVCVVVAGTSFAIDDDWYLKYPAGINAKNLLINVGAAGGFSASGAPLGAVVAFDYMVPLNGLSFGFGGSVGYNYETHGKDTKGDAFVYQYIPLGVRFTWHPDLGVDKLGVYAVVGVAPTLWFQDYEEWDSSAGKSIRKTKTGIYLAGIVNVGAGVRWFFAPNFGLYAEAGMFSVNVATLGITLKM